LKNCYQHVDFWINYLFELEKQDTSVEQMKQVGMQAIGQLMQSGQLTGTFAGRILIHCHEAIARVMGISEATEPQLDASYEDAVLFMAEHSSLEGLHQQQLEMLRTHA
jgi:hypothetical protein